MAKERQRLNLNLDTLFPGETLKIGDTIVQIRPLGIKQLATISRTLKGFGELLNGEGVTWENYGEVDNMVRIATVLLEQFPEVLSEAADIHIDDLEQLPLDCILEIVDTVVGVNLKSKEKFEGNFKSLISKLAVQNATLPKKKLKLKSQKRSKN